MKKLCFFVMFCIVVGGFVFADGAAEVIDGVGKVVDTTRDIQRAFTPSSSSSSPSRPSSSSSQPPPPPPPSSQISYDGTYWSSYDGKVGFEDWNVNATDSLARDILRRNFGNNQIDVEDISYNLDSEDFHMIDNIVLLNTKKHPGLSDNDFFTYVVKRSQEGSSWDGWVVFTLYWNPTRQSPLLDSNFFNKVIYFQMH